MIRANKYGQADECAEIELTDEEKAMAKSVKVSSRLKWRSWLGHLILKVTINILWMTILKSKFVRK